MASHVSLLAQLAVLCCAFGSSRACTTLVVGKDASKDGSVFLSHSNDFEANPDARLCWVPAREHAPGSMRSIYWGKEDYMRHVGYDRGECYFPGEGQQMSKPIGSIPQVGHTFAYFEAQYGIVNEHGLGIGETTCSGVFGANATGHDGEALMSVDELSRIAMERTKSARAAVQLMGGLAEKHGFYGADSFEGTAESLMVGDPDEAFIFHILPDDTGRSAIWVAQRVPDDHVGVVANMFVIRGVDFSDSHNFLFSETVRSVAIERGWWKPEQGALDFTRVYSAGEYAQKFYSGRRVWGAYRLFGIQLPDDYSDLRYHAVYPVTSKAPKAIVAQDLFAIHRSYYEGTKFDMTKGLAAGPWGDPDRWVTSSSLKGGWERSIGIYRTSTTHVVQTKRTGQGAVVWFAPHASATSVFMPVAAKGTVVPGPYTRADPRAFDRGSAYWAHRIVFNVAKIKYNYTMADVRKRQSQLEEEGARLVRSLDAAGLVDGSELNRVYGRHAQHILDTYSALPMELLAKYADGRVDEMVSLSYPDWWLKAVGYEQGPPPPPRPRPVITVSVADGLDAHVERCVAECPSPGFAACARRCLGAAAEDPLLV